MNKLISLILFSFLGCTITAQIAVNKSDTTWIDNDSIILVASPEVRGNIQWQVSTDSINWANIPNATNDTLSFEVDSSAVYRLMIQDGTCDPIYSDTIIILTDCIYNIDDFRLIDITGFTDWEHLLLIEDGRYIATKNNDVLLPDTIFYKPTLEHEGYIIICDENSTPSKMIYEDYIFLFENFTDDHVDVAIIDPYKEITFIRGIQHNLDFTLLDQATKNSDTAKALKWAMLAGSGVACIGGVAAASTGIGLAVAYLSCASFTVQLMEAIHNTDHQVVDLVNTEVGFVTTAFACGSLDPFGCIGGTISLVTGLLIEVEESLQYNSTEIEKALGSMENVLVNGFGYVNDIDGNNYSTVKVGSQWWLAENFQSSKLNDGTNLNYFKSNEQWAAHLGAGFGYYGNDSLLYRDIYGPLYNWAAVKTGKLCPDNWHVPSDSDWTDLTNYLGGSSIAGGMLKSKGFEYWKTPNLGASDTIKFTALPGGYKYATFDSSGWNATGWNWGATTIGIWWTSTISQTNWVFYRKLDYLNQSISRNNIYYPESLPGYSVRCIKDQ